MKEKTLVILAAGMGSRFGGLKQITPVGPSGEIIADYSVYDAIRAGFTKVVFVIKKENYEYFKENITSKYQDKIQVEFAFQNLTDIPSDIILPNNRIKMLGTAHALYVTRNIVREDFAVISADDFYGQDSFKLLSEFLDNETHDYGVVGYQIGDTISETGAVKRGVCFEKDGYLDKIIESKVEKVNDVIVCEPLDGNNSFNVFKKHPVSMLMFGLRPSIFPYIENNISAFFNNQSDLENVEYFLPFVLDEMMNKNLVKIKVISTKEKWLGITYREDLEELQNNIQEMIKEGKYPVNLWEQ